MCSYDRTWCRILSITMKSSDRQAIQSGMQRFEVLHQKLANLPAQAPQYNNGKRRGPLFSWRSVFFSNHLGFSSCSLMFPPPCGALHLAEVFNPLADQAQRLHEEFLRLQQKGMQLASGQLMLEAPTWAQKRRHVKVKKTEIFLQVLF